jgi:hypothetical protein
MTERVAERAQQQLCEKEREVSRAPEQWGEGALEGLEQPFGMSPEMPFPAGPWVRGGEEASLDELFDDPIMALVLRRDRLDPVTARTELEEMCGRIRRRRARRQKSVHARVPVGET